MNGLIYILSKQFSCKSLDDFMIKRGSLFFGVFGIFYHDDVFYDFVGVYKISTCLFGGKIFLKSEIRKIKIFSNFFYFYNF